MRFTTFFVLATIALSITSPAFGQAKVVDSDTIFREVSRRPVRRDHSAKIEALLRKMTIEEKVGQMTQLTIDMVTTGDDQEVKIDEAKLRKAVVEYGVGSILNVNNQAISIDHWHRIIGPIQQAAQKTRLKIPVIYGVDSIHGAN
jgi:beta-glucosidase